MTNSMWLDAMKEPCVHVSINMLHITNALIVVFREHLERCSRSYPGSQGPRNGNIDRMKNEEWKRYWVHVLLVNNNL